MASYHQMGHDSWNLIDEQGMEGYAGLVLSPVNDTPEEVVIRLSRIGKIRKSLEVILDPQLYKPSSDRGQIATWEHMADDIDTADLSNQKWWKDRCEMLVKIAARVGATAICSPAMLPRVFDDTYYQHVVGCAEMLVAAAKKAKLDALMTTIVRVPELAQKGRAEHLASILSSGSASRIYLVLHDDLYPRAQRTDFAALAGCAKLIRLLKAADMKVLVAFCGLDLLVWKAAGAHHVATGKFFNLRRFVPGRWNDAPEGGRVVPYWTDETLVTWLREDDLRLLDSKGLIDRDAAASNPYAKLILEIVDSGRDEAWVAFGWRQYLCWFMQVESALDRDPEQAEKMLMAADNRWGEVVEQKVYLFDRQNNGEWIRPWLNAIAQSAL